MLTSGTHKLLNDLLFELLGERESKLLIAVCDDPDTGNQLRETLMQSLQNAGKKVGFVFTAKASNNILKEFFEQSQAGTMDVLIVLGLEQMQAAAAERFLTELNFHRDWLVGLKMPIVLWLSDAILLQLPSLAPDFWSRRTAIYHFTRRTTAALLTRLFDRGKGNAQFGQRSPTAKAVDSIIKSERALNKCIRGRSFKVEHADTLIGNLQDNISILRHEAGDGRPIDVALYLWHRAKLDKVLENYIDELSQDTRNIFEYLYTDRNEALLFVAQKLPTIFDSYLKVLPEKVQNKRRLDLVALFRDTAIAKLNEIAEELEASIGVSIDQFPDISDEAFDDDDYADAAYLDLAYAEGLYAKEPYRTIERIFDSQSAYELQGWLAGYIEEKPSAFTTAEGELLKLLYSQGQNIDELSERTAMSVSQLHEEIQRLELKVRAFLGDFGARVVSQQSPDEGDGSTT